RRLGRAGAERSAGRPRGPAAPARRRRRPRPPLRPAGMRGARVTETPSRWRKLLAIFSTKPLRELLYRLRTEGGSPPRLAISVALGVFIGCLPLYGIHFLLCFV